MVYGTDEFRARVDFLLSASRHYIFLSSYRVYDETIPLCEDSPRLLDSCDDREYLKTDEYGLTKARQENILHERGGKCNWTIIRPAITYSTARFQFGVLEADVLCWRALNGLPVIMPPEMLKKETTLTWGGDVAKMIATLVLNPTAFGEVFTTATAEHHTWREVFSIYNHLLNVELVECMLSDYQWVTNAKWQIRYDRMLNRIVNNQKVLNASGLQQSELMQLKAGLALELNQLKEDSKWLKPNIGINARMDAVLGLPLIQCLRLYRASWKDKYTYISCRYPWMQTSFCFRAARYLFRHLKMLFSV
jgi:nucleoside-diphosphate-sugar epimerase